MIYTDHLIHSPKVPFFRTRGRGELLDAPFTVSVITAPAPNTRPYLDIHADGHAELRAAFARRWRMVLAVAADNQQEHLVLGAWGCGAFGGDPNMAAETAAEALSENCGSVTHVTFAIPTKGRVSRQNHEAFAAVFSLPRAD